MKSSCSDFSSQKNNGWVEWYCRQSGHEFLCMVDEQYIRDSFNLYGLKQIFMRYSEAYNMILREERPEQEQLEDQQFIQVYGQAVDLYGLIHARYIQTPKGLNIMKSKYIRGQFGRCPRVLCQKQRVMPIGLSQNLRVSRAKIYCPRCQEVYIPTSDNQKIDGAYFGCSFPNLILMTFPELRREKIQTIFIPRVYGFKVSGKKGSRFDINQQKQKFTYFTQQKLEKIRQLNKQKSRSINSENLQ